MSYSDLRKKMNQKKANKKKQNEDAEKKENLVRDKTDYNIPDRSHGDLYCALCDSHMNAEAMWQAHIVGKKHIKNVNKEGAVEKKYEILDEPCRIQEELDGIEGEAVVGLKHIDEIYRKKASAPIYMCYLCHSNISMGSLLIEHVLSYKHRLAYVKENDPQKFHSIDLSNFSKTTSEDLISEFAAELETRFGRGCITVKKEIEKPEALRTWPATKAPRTPPLTSAVESCPYDVQRTPEPVRRSERDTSRRLRSPSYEQGSSYRRTRSPSPYRRMHSPSHKHGRSASPPYRRHMDHSPSPPRRYRERSRSAPRRCKGRSPAKKTRRRRESKPKRSQKSQKKKRSSSSYSSSSCHEHEHFCARRPVEDSEPSHSYQPEIRNPSFNVLHRSPVQHSLVLPAASSSSNFFLTTDREEMLSSVRQALFHNGTLTRNQAEVNASANNGTTYEYAPRHMILDNIILRNTQRNSQENEYSPDHVRKMIMSLSNADFFDIVRDKLGRLPVTQENNRFLEQLHHDIGSILNHRRSIQSPQIVYSAASISSNVLSEPRSTSSPLSNIVRVSNQPLDEFLAMSRNKF